MLDKDTRTAILALSGKGYGVRRIARELKLSRNSVRRVIQSGVAQPAMADRRSQLEEHLEEIQQFYVECGGNLVRVREKLEEALTSHRRHSGPCYLGHRNRRDCRSIGWGSSFDWICRLAGSQGGYLLGWFPCPRSLLRPTTFPPSC